MEQVLELEGNKIDSLLIEMTDIVRKLRSHGAGPAHTDAAAARMCPPPVAPGADGPRVTAG